MKKAIASVLQALLVLLILIPTIAHSQTTTVIVDDLKYFLDLETRTATVIQTAKYEINNLIIPEKITSDDIEYTVTEIGRDIAEYSALSGSVKMPNTIIEIKERAFHNTLITAIEWSQSLEIIGDMAFDNCKYLTGELTLPKTLKSIGKKAFSRCSNLTGDLVIPNSVTFIGEEAFSSCKSLTGSLIIPNSVTQIEPSAFSNCAFTGKLTIPNSWETIPSYCFRYSNFSEIEIPEGMKTIDGWAFGYCKSLTGDLVIPNSVTRIEGCAFYGCENIENITIGENNEYIGDHAFEGCSNVKTIDIKSTIHIGEGAFSECSKLETLILPENLKSIGNFALFNLNDEVSSPDKIICHAPIPPKNGSYIGSMYLVFNNFNSQLFVPAESLELYKTAEGWSKFFKILPIGATAIGDVAEDADVKVSVADGAVVVTAPVGETVTVYNISGMCLAETKEHRISGLAPGIYLVRVADRTFKVAL